MEELQIQTTLDLPNTLIFRFELQFGATERPLELKTPFASTLPQPRARINGKANPLYVVSIDLQLLKPKLKGWDAVTNVCFLRYQCISVQFTGFIDGLVRRWDGKT